MLKLRHRRVIFMDKKKNQWWIPLVAVFGSLALSGGSLFGCYKCAEYVYDGDATVSETEQPQADEPILITEKISETNEIPDNNTIEESLSETMPTEENNEEIVTEEPIEEVDEPQEIVEEVKEEVVTNDFLISLKANMDSNLADPVYDILTNVIGFTKLKYIERDGENYNYLIDADGARIYVTAMPATEEDPEYIRIFQPHGDVFYDDGEIITTAAEHAEEQEHISNMSSYYFMAQNVITDSLNIPNKMKFPSMLTTDDVHMGWKDEYVLVVSYVDIKNEYGQYMRYDYMVEFIPLDFKTSTCIPVYINFAGQEDGELVPID